jgi:hypothetical protein
MGECQKLAFRVRNIAVHCLTKLILGVPPIQGVKSPAD